jgi:tetratricopeptide (TPR) repeat protein
LGIALLGLVGQPGRILAQQGNVLLESSEPLFTVLAARMAAGCERTSSVEAGTETWGEVRDYLTARKPPILSELRRFFDEHAAASALGGELGQYVSLSLLLGPPPDFRFVVPQSDLPPDAKALVNLIPLLKTFHEQGNLTELWARVRSRHEQETERYSPLVRRIIERTDAYLRFPGGAYLGRTYTIYLSLLGPPEQVHARIYGQNYFLVVTPAREPKLEEIRHQYLHFLLDPLAVKYAPEIKQKAALQALARKAEVLGLDFKEDFPLLVTECLIRAAELRMDKRADAEKNVQDWTAAGLILVPYFYAALADYEKQDASMNVAYKSLVLGIDLAKEKERLASVKFTVAETSAAAAQPAAPLSEEERLLNEGDNLIFEGRYAEAKAAFQTVLEKINPQSERALFGMAVVASNTRKPGLAEEYFKKALTATRDLWIATWSHIYLGRIYDLDGRREDALKEYRAASLTAPAYPDAFRAVERGLVMPFGFKESVPDK